MHELGAGGRQAGGAFTAWMAQRPALNESVSSSWGIILELALLGFRKH